MTIQRPSASATIHYLFGLKPQAAVPDAPPANGDMVKVNATGAVGVIEDTRRIGTVDRDQWKVRVGKDQTIWLFDDRFTITKRAA